jgi:aminoglycoside 3-N-acetyltransferase
MIYSKSEFINMMEDMGIQPDDTLVVHSSMKAIGNVDGGADTVLDAFMEYLEEEGLLILPAHTWKQMGDSYPVFDPETESSCTGILSDLFRQRPGVVRSLHPTHSVAVYGKRKEEFIKGEEQCNTPCTPGGCWSRIEEEQGKILLIGVGHERNTFIHAVEEQLNVPDRLSSSPFDFYIQMKDGSLFHRPMYKHYNTKVSHISESYPKLDQAFYENGAAKKIKFGDADCILCDAGKIADVVKRVLSHEINCLIDREEIPREWYI